MSLTIEVFPRIHVGLISMHEGGPRRNGGLGFSIAAPSATLSFERSESFSLTDMRNTPMSEAERYAILSRLDALVDKFSLKSGVAISLKGKMLTHHGMGSGSAIRLACIEGALLSEGIKHEAADIVAASGRGGTSGVGISTYFSGGFVFDLGLSSEKGTGFLPSSRVNAVSVPLVLTQTNFPQWPLGLCIPRDCKPKTQDEEVEFFERATPISQDGSYEAAYISVFGVLSSVLEMDYRKFSSAINMMQATTWKRLEAEQYGHDLQMARSALMELGADCVGMSSLGPMLYFFGSDDRLREIYDKQTELKADVILTMPNNVGRKIVKT